MNKSKLIQMLVLLTAITVIAGGFLRIVRRNSMSLTEYERLNMTSENTDASSQGSSAENLPAAGEADPPSQNGSAEDSASGEAGPPSQDDSMEDSASGEAGLPSQNGSAEDPASNGAGLPLLTGASLNGNSQADSRVTYQEGFYFEPISDSLRRYITGISYPAPDSTASAQAPEITVDELRYVHILHYDFNGDPAEGELICNEYIAQDLVEIFYELYRSEYQLEKVLLIDEYDGDDTASMADNNTSCFNYRTVADKASLSKHAYGLAVDVNPLYNPYITYEKDGAENISPTAAAPYADRSASFPYKIDDSDLCYRLFTEHGFTWGGNWNNSKDYQHFQKTKP